MTSAISSDSNPSGFPVVFYDGICGLCNRFVRLAVKFDRKSLLRFAPLQGETASKTLSPRDREELSSIVFVDSSGTFRKSDAVLRIATRILSRSNAGWKLVGALKIFPLHLRNSAYDWVARNRYRRFGKYETCPLPPPDVRERFLP